MSELFDNLITDRTQEDVQNRTAKGAYNVSDMNRVEDVTAYLIGIMIALPDELKAYAKELGVEWNEFYNVPYDPERLRLIVKTDWTMADIPNTMDSERYLGNISVLCNGLHTSAEDLPKTLDHLFYRDANAIEDCLKRAGSTFRQLKTELMGRLTKTVEAWPRAGEIFGGEMP